MFIFLAKGPKAAVEEYITAMQRKNFDTLYEMNYESQRKVLLILRETTERREDLLKENYLAEKQAFEKAIVQAQTFRFSGQKNSCSCLI